MLLVAPLHFDGSVAEMFRQVEAAPDAVVLLGAVPTRPDPNLGYFVTRPIPGAVPGASVAEVVEQVEKPTETDAEALLARGSVYWNTMCYAVRAERALEVYRSRRPEMTAAVFTGPRHIPPYRLPSDTAVRASMSLPFSMARTRWCEISRMPSIAWLSTSGCANLLAYASTQWVNASMPVAAVTAGGIVTVKSGST